MSALRSIILAPLSALYGAGVQARSAMYRRGWLRVARLAAPVISVGNLTTGGTGKTPLVEVVARALAGKGLKVCVLTRGYGRQNAARQVVVSDGLNIFADASEAGDEPRLLAERLQGLAAVISNADRYAAGTWALANLGSQVFVLDDGFQHLRLARDLNIVTIDATRTWTAERLLPWGHRRESPTALSRADCVVITRADQCADLNALRAAMASLIPDKPIFVSRMKVRSFRLLDDALSTERETAGDGIAEIPQPCVAFCGLGNPASFFSQLASAGCPPATSRIFPDHHRYTQSDLNDLVKTAQRAGAASLVTTAKDAVKLHGLSLALPCYVMEIEISLDNEPRFLELIHLATTKD